jgi:hypothetical protein
MDHRLAFVTLVGLLMGAGTPLAFAWARLLPEDAPPFPIEPGSFPSVDHEAPQEEPARKDYLIAAPLILCLTIAFVFRVPGFPSGTILGWLSRAIPVLGESWSAITVQVFIALVGVGTIVLGALRPGPLRLPLVTAGALTLALWFLAPLLQAAMLSGA